MEYLNCQNIIGWLLIITGILDAYKYILQGRKISRNKSAKGISRMFMNYALSQDIIKLIYSIIIRDLYIFTISLLSLGSMIFMWEMIRKYYPYRCRGLCNFKRPNIFIYILNSLLPNRIRKRL